MTQYKIKSYQSGYEDEQERIGIEVAKSFLVPHQTNKERLKEIYSQPEFDPETRLYAFSGNKMIGFLTAKILEMDVDGIKKANLTPPSVLPEHIKAKNLLFNNAIEILKKKGVKQVLSTFGPRCNIPVEQAIKWGYKLLQQNHYVYSIDFSDLDEISTDKVIEFDFEKHLAACIKIIAEEYGQTEDFAARLFENIKNNPIPNRHILVIEENNEICAFTGIGPNNINPTIGGIMAIYAKNEHYMKQLLAKLKQIVEQENFQVAQLGFTDENDIKQKKYSPIKVKLISKGGQFLKEL
ncbi:MAG: GNAT family N-acetyltransferase [Candidatus Heimdallarchaeota archaeon]|nr:GNAT family N-acetyltransferase [Candidatus Heimdallarchaeota archaeon]